MRKNSAAPSLQVDTPEQPRVDFQQEGQARSAHHTWFRGEHCNYSPKLSGMVGEDAVLKHVLAGWLPPRPLIDPGTRVVAFGSCFATHITEYLSKRNFNVLTAKDGGHGSAYVVRMGEGMVNSFAIRQQFEWAFENQAPQVELWHGYDATAFGYDEATRQATRSVLEAGDLFIITLGLSEVWYDEPTGGVFWRAVPREKYDPARHRFRVSSVAENRDNITAIYRLIRKHRPGARVILTLSPIPLIATFRPVSCITANSASKAILRAAIDEAYRGIDEPESLFYWPSYEIVMEAFGERWHPDRHHVKSAVLEFVMVAFEHAWCVSPRPSRSLLQAWVGARCATGTLPRTLPRMLANDNTFALERLTQRLRARRPRDAELIDALRKELAVGRV